MKSIFFVLCALQLTACSGLMGSLRPDLNDGDTGNSGPTVGGAWSERGFLSEDAPESGSMDHYNAVGHSERSPASEGSAPDPSSQEWGGSPNRELGQEGGTPTSYSDNPNVAPPARRMYKNGQRASAADFRDESPNEGSLWASDGQTNYYFTKNKIRSPGDIISVEMEPDLIRDVGTEIKRTLNPREKDIELGLAQERLRRQAMGQTDPTKDSVATSAAAPNRAPAAATPPADASQAGFSTVDVPTATPADVDVSKSLEIKTGDIMMAEIVERYPNGNYKIRGVKRIPYKNGAARLVSVVGVARGTDISEDDVVKSGKLYEYQIQALR